MVPLPGIDELTLERFEPQGCELTHKIQHSVIQASKTAGYACFVE